MSILIHIYYSGQEGSALAFAKEMMESHLVDEIRAEPGNLRYEYAIPMEDKETVLLIDEWKDQEALDIHHQLPLMDKISQLRDKYDLSMRVERFESKEAVSKDQKYIRSK